MVSALAICGIRKKRAAQMLGIWSILGRSLFLSIRDDAPIWHWGVSPCLEYGCALLLHDVPL